MSNSVEEIHCPICGSRITLDAVLAKNTEASYWKTIFELPRNVQNEIHGYVTLFRPEKSRLSSSRALRILKETLGLCDDLERLGSACAKTVDQIHAKRKDGEKYSAFSNHAYLEKVLSSTPSTVERNVPKVIQQSVVKTSKQSQGLNALERLKR